MMRAKDYKTILQVVTQNINEGIYIVTADGMSIVYNERMSRLEEMRIEDVLGKNIKEVQSHILDEESTLYKALKYKITTPNYHQTFINQYGKEITTINTTIPVIGETGDVIAAVEIAKDVTDIKKMSNTILDLQSETIGTEASKEKGMKRYTFESLIGSSVNFENTIDKCKRAAKVNATVLIYGETGTGKELLAQSIHYESDRRGKPFLAQNCAAIPENLLEGILFGTAKGGFTGAIDRAGLFEQANGGTLLLDEISAMPYDLQSKLLRVLQESYIRRIGGKKDIPIDVRIIATINEKAEELIARGKLRKDLYYRLKIIEINVPPLRERKSDILLLADYFIQKYNELFKKKIRCISEKGLALLLDYDYPGNVRELEHILMSIVSLSEDEDCIREDQLELPFASPVKKKEQMANDLKDQGLEKYIESIEKALILEAFESAGGLVSRSAKNLGLKRQTMQYKLKKYGIAVNEEIQDNGR